MDSTQAETELMLAIVLGMKEGRHYEKVIAERGYTLRRLVRAGHEDYSKQGLDMFRLGLDARCGGDLLKGNTLYVVKRLTPGSMDTDISAKVLDNSNQFGYETIVLTAVSPIELGYRDDEDGYRVYLARADSADKAVVKTKDIRHEPMFEFSWKEIVKTQDMRDIDTKLTRMLMNPTIYTVTLMKD